MFRFTKSQEKQDKTPERKKDTFAFEELSSDLQFSVYQLFSSDETAFRSSVSKEWSKKLDGNILWNKFLKPEFRVKQAKDEKQSAKIIFTVSPEKRIDKVKYYLAKHLCGELAPIKARVIEQSKAEKARHGEDIRVIEPEEIAKKWPDGFFTEALYKGQFKEISENEYHSLVQLPGKKT